MCSTVGCVAAVISFRVSKMCGILNQFCNHQLIHYSTMKLLGL